MKEPIIIKSYGNTTVLDRDALEWALEHLKVDVNGNQTSIIEAERQIVALRNLIDSKREDIITMTLGINKVKKALYELDIKGITSEK